MVFAEVAKTEAVQVALVGGVAERAEIGVVRRLDAHRAARAHQPVKLLHGAHHVVDVFDDMDGRQPVERAVGERVRKTVQVRQDVGAAGGVAVDTDGAGLLVKAAADVEDSHLRYSSSVSMAKSHWSRVTTSGGHSRMLLSPAPSTSRPRSNAWRNTPSRSSGAFCLVSRSRTSSIPIISPSPRTSPTWGNRAGHSRMRSMRCDPMRAAFSTRPCSIATPRTCESSSSRGDCPIAGIT